MTHSVELLAKIAVWRRKATDGTITLEEMKEAVAALRGDRKAAATVSESSRRSKNKAEVKSADDMLDELGKI